MSIITAIEIPEARGASVFGDLVIPDHAIGLVIFAHGSGSSRHSPRNRDVAAYLQSHGLATLLMDLLTPDEERIDNITREFRFDIPLLAQRLEGATAWARTEPAVRTLPIGYFGASTGAAAALIAAARHPDGLQAVVSRGGRPDLAGDFLADVEAPTLFIVGSLDTVVIELNDVASSQMYCARETSIVPGATHLFEEPGTLDQVQKLAADWFVAHFSPATP